MAIAESFMLEVLRKDLFLKLLAFPFRLIYLHIRIMPENRD
jgi:hypothetical protein